jgi:hypothetical protein
MWILKNGTFLAIYGYGENLTGSLAQEAGPDTFAVFAELQNVANVSMYITSSDYHLTGMATLPIGPTLVSVKSYGANSLPETLNECGVTEIITAFSLSIGTPVGSNSSLIVQEHLTEHNAAGVLNEADDVGLLVTSITLASNSSSTYIPRWSGGPAYPLVVGGNTGVVGQFCVNGTATIYCIGGIGYNGTFVDNVYSAPASSTGLGNWTADTPYPLSIGGESCITYSSDVYCVGGNTDDAGDSTAASYFATLSGSEVGSWSATTPYPIAVDSESCVSSSGYIYCVGGQNATDGTNESLGSSNSAWYAPVSASGIGTWKQTSAFPSGVDFTSCAATTTDIFCVGGFDASYNGLNDTYFAPLTVNGIGQWSSTTPYPIAVQGQSCVIDSGDMICVGGIASASTSPIAAVYVASVSSSGLGPWHHTASYPITEDTICTFAEGNIYCVGGETNSFDYWSDFVYYASVESLI